LILPRYTQPEAEGNQTSTGEAQTESA
jgi:hypothetical protein